MKLILHKAKEAKRAIELPDGVVRAILIIMALVLFFTVRPNETINSSGDILTKNNHQVIETHEGWP